MTKFAGTTHGTFTTENNPNREEERKGIKQTPTTAMKLARKTLFGKEKPTALSCKEQRLPSLDKKS